MVYDTNKVGSSVMLALGCVANLMLALCLAHTWKHWRQVRNSDVHDTGTVGLAHYWAQ